MKDTNHGARVTIPSGCSSNATSVESADSRALFPFLTSVALTSAAEAGTRVEREVLVVCGVVLVGRVAADFGAAFVTVEFFAGILACSLLYVMFALSVVFGSKYDVF